MMTHWHSIWPPLLLLIGSCIGAPHAHGEAKSSPPPFGFAPARDLNDYAFASGDREDWDNALAADGSGVWVAIWRSYYAPGIQIPKGSYLIVSSSMNSGRTWSPAKTLNPNAASESTEDGGEALVTGSGGRYICAWQSSEPLLIPRANLGDEDLVFSISDDQGQTWSVPNVLNSLATIDTEADYRVDLAADGKGGCIAVYMSESNPNGTPSQDPDIHFSMSTDNGTTWSAQLPLQSNFASDSGNDFLPTIATDRKGLWMTVWASNDRRSTPGAADYDILCAISSNGGVSWTQPRLLNNGGDTDVWDDGFLDASIILYRGPQVATDGNGVWVVTWGSYAPASGESVGEDTDILFARSTDQGSTWSDPLPLNSNAATDQLGAPGFRYDLDPRLLYDGQGNWICTWETQAFSPADSNEFDLAISRSTDGGQTWSPIRALNSNYQTDTGWDFSPSIATDGQGHWGAIWCSTDPQFGGGGPSPFAESDIAYSFSCNLDPPKPAVIIQYLLGLSPSPAGLDVNCDGRVDAADVVLQNIP